MLEEKGGRSSVSRDVTNGDASNFFKENKSKTKEMQK